MFRVISLYLAYAYYFWSVDANRILSSSSEATTFNTATHEAATATRFYTFSTDESLPENLVLRDNGQLIVTSVTTPRIFQLDPGGDTSQRARLVHEFTGFSSAMGIVQLNEDLFAVAVGNLTLTSTGPGTWAIWTVDLSEYNAPTYNSSLVRVQKVVDLPTAPTLDGLTAINATQGLLAAGDVAEGTIWIIDLHNKTARVLVQDPLLVGINGTGNAFDPLGINGLKFHNDKLYFTNTGKKFLGYVDPNTSAITQVFNYTVRVDDFSVAKSGNFYLSTLDTPDGGILRRKAGTPSGQNGTDMVIAGTGHSAVLASEINNGCRVITLSGITGDAWRTYLPGLC